MHEITFLQDLAIVLIIAAVVTVVFRQFKQPVVLGYILAGVIIGPHTPPFPLITDEHQIKTLSELGVIFLMFSLGLEFSLRKLKEVGSTALIAAAFEILLMVFVGYEIGRIFHWGLMDSVFLGAILAISSTTIIIKALEELGKTKERFAQLVFGILIVEDILGIVMIALLSGFAATGSLAPADVVNTLLKLSAFLGVLLVAGLIIVPRLLDYVAKFKSNEMLLITVLGLCFGVSLVTVKLGYSVALGAFLIGAIIAEARQIAKIEALTHPVRDLFSAVFFVSIGLLIDPRLLVQYWLPILVISAAVAIGKVLTCSFGTFIAGHDMRSSLRVGMSLAQIGEFSFIIAALGLSLKVTSDFLYPIAVAVSAVTTLLTPYLIKSSDALANRFERLAPLSLRNSLDAYTRWVGQLGQGSTSLGAKLLRQWGWQITLNLLLVTAAFIAAIYFRGYVTGRWPNLPGGDEAPKALAWLAAMIVSLPMLLAIFRKIQAAGLLVSELSVTREAGGENTPALRAIISGIVLTAGCAGLVLCILLLSSVILPSWNVLIVVILVLGAAAVILRRSSTRLYAKAQIALHETLTQPVVDRHAPAASSLPHPLAEATLRHITIEPASPAVRQMIGELKLRTKTGATIVGIERHGENIINPSPDEEIMEGDRILLLGTTAHLDAAQSLFQEKT